MFKEKTFAIPQLNGISADSINEHLGLYSGYVKNFNGICELLGKLMHDESNSIALAELQRRMSFEFGGMRLHEYYFAHLEGGPTPLNQESTLAQKMISQFGSIDQTIKFLKNVAMMRGPGWAIMYYDPKSNNLMFGFSEEQHQGHFVSLPVILALDVWEHCYIKDYGALGKGKYVDAFLNNLNWSTCETNFKNAQ